MKILMYTLNAIAYILAVEVGGFFAVLAVVLGQLCIGILAMTIIHEQDKKIWTKNTLEK